MATVQCPKCTAERKGFRRELDSWRHKLIHCVGFESILEGIYGPLLMRDLNLFDDCEPEEVDDWSPEASCSQCSFCNLPLEKLSDQVPAATSPLSSPSDYSPCQTLSISESSQSAHRFLQAVFHKKDVPLGCDSNIPLVAQELMKKMIHQFALEYASKCLLHTSTNGVTTRTSSPSTETEDAPLDLTVSRSQEQKEGESQPDGVLDLSNRNSACSATSLTSSSNHKASGCLLPTIKETSGDLGQREMKHLQSSTLHAVFNSLCPSHRSLLYQILKVAHQEKMLFLNHRPTGQMESHCCHCGIHPQDKVTPNAVPFSECKTHNSSLHYPLPACDHQGHSCTAYHQGVCKSNCSIHNYTLTDYKSEAPQGSSYCCLQRSRMETYTGLCPERLHCISCRSLAAGRINNKVCSFASSPSSSKSPSMCPLSSCLCPSSSICCNQHNPHSCSCYSNHACLEQVRGTIDRELGNGDPPCPILKREQSPSPPPLSPIPSDIDKKTDEKPPSLLHHQQEEEDNLMVKDDLVNGCHQEADMDIATEEEREKRTPRLCQAEENPNGTLLQDVVNRFTEKLETIRPLEKDPPLGSAVVCASEKEVPQSPSTSHNLQFHADAHLAEIITTVLHSGRASDYNLSELFNRHDSKEPKSPNTRSRRRQEVLAAMATPNDDASTRRHTLQIKRELAMFDQSMNRKKVPPAKKTRLKDGMVSEATLNTSSDSTLVKEESKRETEEDVDETCRVLEGPRNTLSTENNRDEVKEEIQTVIVTEEVQILKAEEKEMEISNERRDFLLSSPQTPSPELNGNHGKCDLQGDGVTQTVTATSVNPCDKPCGDEGLGSAAGGDRYHQEAPSGPSSDHDHRQDEDCHSFKSKKQKCRSQHSEEARRSRRNIVPPKKFSSYVTEPRKMFFVACFSESIFNQKPQKEKASTCTTPDALSKDPDAMDSQLETRGETLLSSPEHTCKLAFESTQREQCGQSHKESNSTSTNQVFPQTVAAKEKSPTKHSLDNGSDSGAKPYGRLRSSFKRLHDSETITSQNTSNMDVTIKSATCVETPLNCQLQYTSPIKLMFVSPVQDKEGVRYSLKSAGSDSSGQAEEPFDPCEESSWSGTLKKLKTVSTQSATSKVKSISSPLKSATSPARSTCSSPKSAPSPPKSRSSPARSVSSTPKSGTSPAKSVSSPARSVSSTPKSASTPIKSSSSPAKSASPKSASSSPKVSSRRSGEGTPTKRAAGTESQRSPGNSVPFHDTTPPKRRPGRPKKLGPQLEQKAKRPIGRPRKQKAVDLETGGKTVNGKSDLPSEVGENVNKNLKITVVYGRSRRNKRTVSEGFDQLQTEFHDACEAVGLKGDLGILMHNSNTSSGNVKTASTELSEELNFVSPVKESAPQSGSNIKCQKRGDSLPSRKPGRPAKVKISGISVTVTTVSPRQRKIQINRDTRQSPDTLLHKKALLPEFNSAKEPRTISHQLTNRSSQTEEERETKEESKDKRPNKPVAVRHSMRVRKPSIHFLHAVATSTSRSYRRSNALLQRSKQLLLNKASNERRQSETASGEKRQLCGQERKISQDLSRVARVSVDSIFTPRETLKWWAASTEEKTMNQELARRIRLISDTWVPDIVESQDKEMVHNHKQGIKGKGKSKHLSVVRTLFNCPPNKPRSCSMQQLCSWFMQTTETQSLAIVKKASSRNPYELMHFPRSANKNSVCRSPQAERLRRHIKKFAKIVPKSPLQHKQAQRQLRKRNEAAQSTHNIRRQLFTSGCATGRLSVRAQRRSSAVGRYLAILLRARTRFLTLKERDRWRKRQKIKKNKKVATSGSGGQLVKELQTTHTALRRSAKYQLSNSLATGSVDQTQEPVDVPKEQNLCSKAWSPEKLKECRVFLRKINSPDNESTEEEWDSCTVTLDDGSPSAYVFTGRERELVGVVKAVKSDRTRCMKRTASRDLAGSAPESVQEQDETPMARQKGKYKSPGVVASEPPQPPPAKTLRQSRMRGLSGPRWCDFVFEN